MGFTKAKSQTRTTNTTMTTHQEGTASSHEPEQPNLEPTKERIVEALRSAGGRLTKSELVNKFFSDLGEDLYYQAEDALIEEQRIERCIGRNGGIRLVQQGDLQSRVDPESNDSTAEESLRKEKNHYELVVQQIKEHWTEERSVKHVYVADTAYQGARKTGGRWSRPDITLCTVSEWIFLARPEGEVITIEIKLFDDVDVTGIYEALAHKSCSHYSYLMIVNFPKQEELVSKKKEDFDKIMVAATRHGIGIIKVPNSNDWNTWEFPLEPTRSDAGHQEINQFLLDQFPGDERNAFADKIREIIDGKDKSE